MHFLNPSHKKLFTFSNFIQEFSLYVCFLFLFLYFLEAKKWGLGVGGEKNRSISPPNRTIPGQWWAAEWPEGSSLQL